MGIKATIVACAFLVQYFENATIVAYAGLRVNRIHRTSFKIIRIPHVAKDYIAMHTMSF